MALPRKDIVPAIGNITITGIKTRTLVQAIQPVQARGALEMVRRLCQRINEVMIYAMNVDLIDAAPSVNISKAFEKSQKKHMPNIRPVEAAETRWQEIDLDAKEWRIPAERMKMKRIHIVPLSEQALAILELIRPLSSYRKYVFPSRIKPLQPMNSQTVNAALKRARLGGILVSHGMRSIASTALNEQGFSPDVIEASLAHVDKNEVRRAYNCSDYLEQRRPMMQW